MGGGQGGGIGPPQHCKASDLEVRQHDVDREVLLAPPAPPPAAGSQGRGGGPSGRR